MKRFFLIIVLSLFWFNSYAMESAKSNCPIKMVAAENFYGELAYEIGGKYVNIDSIMNNPNTDPHLFTINTVTAKNINTADIIIYSGADYDPWMAQLLNNINNKHKPVIINVAMLVGVKSGENPHVWYKIDAFTKLAQALTNKLSTIDPQHKSIFQHNLSRFLQEHDKVLKEISTIKLQCVKTPVIATEPVFGYMADSMGLEMMGLDFQWKVMNNTEPSPQMIANFQNVLNNKIAKILFYNSQVSDPISKIMKDLALKNHIPVVGVTETMPIGVTINQWLLEELNSTKLALEKTCFKNK